MGEYDEVFKQLEETEKEGGVQFYRCILCGKAVSPWDLKKFFGCPKCKGRRVRPSELSFFEKIIQIIKHPKVWEWGC